MINETIAIILAAGPKEKLGPIATPKPLIFVGGKPVILHQIQRLQDAGIKKCFIIASNYKNALKEALENKPDINIELDYIEQSDEDSTILDSILLIQDKIKNNCVITSCDLIFEENPFLNLTYQNEQEMLIDKNVFHNKFCGASIKIKKGLVETSFSDTAENNFNAWGVGIYGFSKAGLDNFIQTILENKEEKNLEKILDKFHKSFKFKLIPLPQMSWFDLNTPEVLIRSELFLRGKEASTRPTKVNVSDLKKIDTPLAFSHKQESITKIYLEPGLMQKISELELMAPERTASTHIIITDEIVDNLFGDLVLEQLVAKGYKIKKLICPVGETAKSMEVYNTFAEKIISLGIDQQSIIFALGGGVVANLSGFLAATLYRGIGLIHIPTTLMNMLDVSISIKQGINGQKGKNLVGSWYPPLSVLIDPSISIPDWLMQDGIPEAIKHAICQDKEFFNYLLKNKKALDDVSFREHIIRQTVALKTELMDKDMFEDHSGMILLYGHEIGHAIEFLSHFDLTHGKAISIGMRATAQLAYLMDVTDKETLEDHKNIFKHYDLPYKIPADLSIDAIIEALKYNKKNQSDEFRVILPEFTGKAWKIKGNYGIPCREDLIREAIKQSYEK